MSEKTQNNSKTDAMKTYNYADAVEVAKRYFKGDDLAATVWVSKYALKWEIFTKSLRSRCTAGSPTKSNGSNGAIRIR